MDSIEIADRIETYWDDWHMNYENGIMTNGNPKKYITDPLSGIHERARETLEIFDTWKPPRTPESDAAVATRLETFDAQFKIGIAAQVGRDGYDPEKSYTWTPNTMQVCIRQKMDRILREAYEDPQILGSVFKEIRDNFVRAMRRRTVELDESVPTEFQSGNSFPSILPVAENIMPDAEQTDLMWNQLAVMTYGYLAEANREEVTVPFKPEEISIEKERNKRPFTRALHETIDRWTAGFSPTLYPPSETTPWIYALHNNRIVGFVGGYVGDSSRRYDWVEVAGIAVGSHFQKGGIGKRLLDAFEEILPDGVKKLTAEAVFSSLPFWYSQGFQDKWRSSRYPNCMTVERTRTPKGILKNPSEFPPSF